MKHLLKITLIFIIATLLCFVVYSYYQRMHRTTTEISSAAHLLALQCSKSESCLTQGTIEQFKTMLIRYGKFNRTIYHYKSEIRVNGRTYTRDIYSRELLLGLKGYDYTPDKARQLETEKRFSEQFIFDPENPVDHLPASMAKNLQSSLHLPFDKEMSTVLIVAIIIVLATSRIRRRWRRR